MFCFFTGVLFKLDKKVVPLMRKVISLILLSLLSLKLFSSPSDSLIIELINGERIYNAKIVELRDSLIIDENGQLWSISLDDISKIIVGKSSRFWEFAVKGGIIGFTVGIIPGLIVVGESLEKSQSGDRYADIGIVAGIIIAGIGGGAGLVVGGLIGGIIGAILGKDTVYDFSEMSRVEKIKTIQKLSLKYGK